MLSKNLRNLKPYKTETSPAQIKLSSNELPYDIPYELKEKIKKELEKIPFNRYPDPYAEELREILAERWGVKAENIILGNGSDELILYLTIAVGEPYEGIAYPIPTFPMYRVVAETLRRPFYEIPLNEELEIPEAEFLQFLENYNISLVFISYPNNPTGNLFSKITLEKIRSKLKEKEGLMVSDEAYYDFSKKTFIKEAVKTNSNIVVLRTLSKIGLASLRIGALIGEENLVKEFYKIKLPFNITYPSQVFAKVLLTEGREFLDWAVNTVISERERMFQALKNMEGISKVFPSSANFILFKTPFPANEVHKELLKRGILIRNVSYLPALRNCLRVNIGKPEVNTIFLENLQEVLKNLISKFGDKAL